MRRVFIFIFCAITFISCSRSISVGIKSYAITNSKSDSLFFYLGLKADSKGSDKLLVIVHSFIDPEGKKNFRGSEECNVFLV
jgi:hypothetical protein